jgi:alcohol dehydrogenase class IV
MKFEFATAQRIVFGPATLSQAGGIAASFGRRALVVMGSSQARAQSLIDQLLAGNIAIETMHVSGEPTVALAQRGAQLARDAGCDLVISIGGGSAIDCGKAIAALATNAGDLFDYLEVIGKAQPISQMPLPFIAIPTTAGAGTEATRNAVLTSPAHKMKVSLRSPMMLPKVALVDPQLTHDLPPNVTAATGMDALSQLIEPYVSLRANPMTDALCREGIVRVARSLRQAVEQADDAGAREDMSLAALFGGMALANAGLGAVHGFASPIGGMFPAPHGAVCARLLPGVIEVNVKALREREPASPVLKRYDEVAQWLIGNSKATAFDAAQWLRELSAALKIQPFSAYGMREEDVPDVVQKAAVASSMQANPIKLTEAELSSILRDAL